MAAPACYAFGAEESNQPRPLDSAWTAMQQNTARQLKDNAGASWTDLARDYLSRLVRGEVEQAKASVRAAVSSAHDLRNAYLGVFQPAQYALGELCAAGRVGEVQAYSVTMATQELIEEFAAVVFDRPSLHVAALVTTAPGELHDLGPRMVADFLEMDGFDTTFVTAPRDSDAIVGLLESGDYRLFVMSVTAEANLPPALDLLRRVRQSKAPVEIMVGGQAFNTIGDGAREIPPHLHPGDALEAVRLARRLCDAERAARP